jgi:hypothetical protein
MTKSRKRAQRNAEEANAHQKAPDNTPPKAKLPRFARGLVLVEFSILIGMGIAMLLGLLNASIGSSGGATRSSQVELAERQAEIEQVLRERESAEQSVDHTAGKPSDPPIARLQSDLR